MNDTIEHILSRLENIHSVEPILSAQRTIAMGNWKVALNRLSWVQDYADRLDHIAAVILLHLKKNKLQSQASASKASFKKTTVVMIGSERGLCGAFNRVIAEYAQQHLEKMNQAGAPFDLQVIGARAARILQRQGIHPDQIDSGSSTSLPTPALASQLASHWLAAYETGAMDQVDLIFNSYHGAARYKPQAIQIIPPQPSFHLKKNIPDSWLDIIMETNPAALFAQILVQQLETRIYACLIESAAAENSARFQLLEDARQNIERLTAELEETAAQARRQTITREIQNLAIGAGLLHQE